MSNDEAWPDQPTDRTAMDRDQGDQDQGDRDQGDRDQGDRDQGDRDQCLRVIEAVLFASAQPIDEAVLRQRLPAEVDLAELLGALAASYRERGVNLVRVDRGWAFRTAPDLAIHLRTEATVTRRLSRAAVETLSIIAYHQPITRAEIEEIRGVATSRGTLDILLEAGWLQPRGRRRTPGRPLTWGTTRGFLDHFGLEDLTDLPGLDDLKAAGLLDRRPGLTVITTGEDDDDSADDPDDDGDAGEAPELPLELDGEDTPSP